MITGVILAGGLNRRMGGRLKALLPVQGQPLLLRQLKEMSSICKQIIVVTNEPEALQPHLSSVSDIDVQCVTDHYVQKGSLKWYSCRLLECIRAVIYGLLAVICLLFLPKPRRQWPILCQEANLDAVIPVMEGRVHPLHGIYSRLVGSEAEVLLEQEHLSFDGAAGSY